ncbi:MAG TPA: polyprenyl synthetase family protein [Candidatus Dormibacteraeota bacterium]|nr:polyprenyl synthetase family protein [Candidatus Dormibacteraeota bacterium]
MSGQNLQKLVRLGRRVDPTITAALARGSAKDFRPSLDYHFQAGGKRMRAAMVLLSCGAAGGRPERAVRPAAVAEMIHNYSLVMDDLIDRADVRRGRPTVRAALGDSIALLIAMFYREALDDVIQDCPRSVEVRKIAVGAMKEIIDGERLDLRLEQAGRDDPYLQENRISKPSFDLYLNMVGRKTAALFRAAGQMGAHAADANQHKVDALGLFGWKAGLAFQIMDDVLDICGDQTGKQRGKDVIEHKLGNAVILVALRFLSERKRLELRRILSSEKITAPMVSRATAIIEETPAEADCKEIATKYLVDAKKQLGALRDSSYKRELSGLADKMVTRSY